MEWQSRHLFWWDTHNWRGNNDRSAPSRSPTPYSRRWHALYSGLTRQRAVLLNSVATFGCALGGVLVLVYGDAVALPIAAANFLYIATGILLPELQKEKSGRRSAVQIACLVLALLGIGAISNVTSKQAFIKLKHLPVSQLLK